MQNRNGVRAEAVQNAEIDGPGVGAAGRVTAAFINAVATAVPDHDVHGAFIDWAEARVADPRTRALFRRMAARAGIGHRWSVLPPTADGGSPVAAGGFYGASVEVAGADDVEALLCEKCRERVARQRMVVHDEHAVCHVSLIGRRRAADK